MNIGIVGHESLKFTDSMKLSARYTIEQLLGAAIFECGYGNVTVVSGGCHLGGIDTWAVEVANDLGLPSIVHLPRNRQWSTGYKPRNLKIARDSDEIHVIVVEGYHDGYCPDYPGMRFDHCYHCNSNSHIKSGACWTARQAIRLGKKATWHVIPVS